MRYSIRDVLIAVTFVALFTEFVLSEPTGVIWALAIFSLASVCGVVQLLFAIAFLRQSIQGVIVERSVWPLIAFLEWKKVLLGSTAGLFLVVSVVTANFAINEGSQLNVMLFVCPLLAVYIYWRLA